MIYYIVFGISVIFAYFGQQKRKNKYFSFLLIFISVLIPAWLAGKRDLTIGTDVLMYADQVFNLAQSIANIPQFITLTGVEPLYALLAYFTAIFTNDVSYFLFFTQLLISGGVYLYLWTNKENFDFIAGIIVFYTFVYGCGLNWMRQNIAIVFLLFAIDFYRKNDKVKFTLFMVIAILFHFSAIIGFIFVALIEINRRRFKWFYKAVFLLLFFFIIIYFNIVVGYLVDILNFLPERYKFYSNNIVINNVAFVDIFLYGLMIILSLIKRERDEEYYFLIDVSIISFVGLFFDSARGNFDRIWWYFRIFLINVYPNFLVFFKNTKWNRIAVYLIMFIFGCIVFTYRSAVLGWHEIWPYQFG